MDWRTRIVDLKVIWRILIKDWKTRIVDLRMIWRISRWRFWIREVA